MNAPASSGRPVATPSLGRMAVVRRVLLALALVATLSGCTQPWMRDSWPDGSASPTPTPSGTPTTVTPAPSVSATPSPTADPERDRYPYTGGLGDETCVTATRDQLDELEAVGALGAAVTYSRGALVKANDPWWTVAVATQVNPNDEGLDRNDVDAVQWFVTNAPTLTAGHAVSTWPLEADPDDDAADRALLCLSRVPTPPPAPPDDSPASYTGRLARGATCTAVSAAMLAHLENVGRVGGAITYSRGQMVQANKNWWTVAVATQVHPNNLGHTRENVPETMYFVTNAPTKGSDAVYFAPDSVEQDTAAAAARECLGP